jgi:hypothetical protein
MNVPPSPDKGKSNGGNQLPVEYSAFGSVQAAAASAKNGKISSTLASIVGT